MTMTMTMTSDDEDDDEDDVEVGVCRATLRDGFFKNDVELSFILVVVWGWEFRWRACTNACM